MEGVTLSVDRESGAHGTPAVTCRALHSGYRNKPVLHDVSFTVSEPSVYVVLGPNGAGKTTLFRTIAGILHPTSGEVLIDGVPIVRQESRDQLHYLSHLDGMPDGLTVRESLDFYARVERATSSDVERVLDQLQIREFSGTFISKLSAGQRKRVSIARIFLREREIYLLDEPTASLDPKMAREIRSLILSLSKDRIVLYSSHNLFEAHEIGQYVITLKNGALQLFDRMENVRSAHFVIGVRTLEPTAVLDGWEQRGEYFVRELSGPDQVPALIRDLEGQGVRLREVREMENPLEDLFT
ncbi:MAG TPA: heme ABC exporter ATP-binding protein CcmA [Thermoplasmata archaeon]|nr:heme ABC exporter ATP-binding protein CcmA [Thermoplasmata archaeon]